MFLKKRKSFPQKNVYFFSFVYEPAHMDLLLFVAVKLSSVFVPVCASSECLFLPECHLFLLLECHPRASGRSAVITRFWKSARFLVFYSVRLGYFKSSAFDFSLQVYICID